MAIRIKNAKAYEEVIDFIAAGPTAANVVAFEPSSRVKERVAELVRLEKDPGLTPNDKAELDHYMQLEHLMRLAKARARQHIRHGKISQRRPAQPRRRAR